MTRELTEDEIVIDNIDRFCVTIFNFIIHWI